MRSLKESVPFLVIMLVVVLFMISIKTTMDVEREINDLRYQMQELEIGNISLQLQDQQNLNRELLQIIYELQGEIEGLKFEPWDIPLDPVLQEHTYNRCRSTGIDPALVFAIMEKESQYDVNAIGHNSNGTRDAGAMQVNSVHWSRLERLGIDVHTPEGGIDAGIYLLMELLEKYPEEQALAAYNAGEGGMQKGGGREYARTVIAISNEGFI